MSDNGGREIARGIVRGLCFLGLCILRAAFVFKSPSDFAELIVSAKKDRDRLETL